MMIPMVLEMVGLALRTNREETQMKKRNKFAFDYDLLVIVAAILLLLYAIRLLYAISFGIFVGLLKLILWCFGFLSNWKLAIGILLVLVFINLFIRSNSKK